MFNKVYRVSTKWANALSSGQRQAKPYSETELRWKLKQRKLTLFSDMKHFPCTHHDSPFHSSVTSQMTPKSQSSLGVEVGALGKGYIYILYPACLFSLLWIVCLFVCFCRLEMIITESVTAMLWSRFPSYAGAENLSINCSLSVIKVNVNGWIVLLKGEIQQTE